MKKSLILLGLVLLVLVWSWVFTLLRG